MKKYRTVFAAGIARKLLKEGFRIIDIKPNIRNREATVFIFENSEEFEKAMLKHSGY